jgi:hypothetical protein
MWQIRKLTSGELERDPHETEFFNIGDSDKAISLVREVIQNSLDAKLPACSSVLVRFTFAEHAKSSDDIFYRELIPHIESCALLPQEYLSSDAILFLAIEDFGTSGLDGPINRDEKIKKGGTGNYYDFWWCEGKSQKTGQNAGRWGLGKTAYHVASNLRSFWGLTIRHDDNRELLLGKTILKTHLRNGDTYDCYGYFAGKNYESIETKEILQEFRSKFAITRNGEPGLSIVIPMPAGEIDHNAITRAVIIHYFFPIIKEMLVVQISDDKSEVILNASTLRDIAQQQDWSNSSWKDRPVDSLMEFLEDAATMPGKKKFSLKMPAGTPVMKEDLFGDSLAEACRMFSENKLLWIRIPIIIYPKNGSAVNSYFDVYLQRDETLSKSEEFYIRGGITISEIKRLGNRRVRALLSAQDEAVCTFLGDCESPAHTDWKERTEQFQDKYHGATSTLRFIKSSMADIVRILDQPPPGLERDFLQDIFFIPESIEEAKEEKPETPKPPKELPRPKPQIFEASPILNGFLVVLSDKGVNLPVQAFIRMAYDIRRGNPFSNYHPMDFDLTNGTIKIAVTGGSIIDRGENHIRVSVNEGKFELRVTGFDEHRDLVVDIREAS